MLKHMEAVSRRLHDRILSYSQNDEYLSIQVAIAEVWELMDAMRRAHRFWPIVKITADDTARRVLADIKDVRDSFQHLDERLEHYFQNAGDSVFGDIFWRYRPAAGESEQVITWATGVTIGSANFTKAGIRVNDERFLDRTGIYDFNLIYIKKEPTPKNRKNHAPKHKYIQVSLDEAAGVFNEAIQRLEAQSDQLLVQWQLEAGPVPLTSRGFPPVAIRMRQRADD